METDINSTSTSQPLPQTNQIPSQPIVEPQNNKLVKMLLYVVCAIVFMAIGAFGYSIYQNKNNASGFAPTIAPTATTTQILPSQQPLPTSTTKPTALPTVSNERVYRNEKYNFKFSYPQDWYSEGKLSSSFKLEEKGSQIIITNTVHRSGGDTEDFPNVYTIYDANSTDKIDLAGWWRKNIKTEIGNHLVPTDYNTALNSVPFVGCIKEFDKIWQLPPALEVTPKEGVEEPGPYKGSIYFYYDFGKPFILNFTEESTGACGNKDSYLVFTSISRLH